MTRWMLVPWHQVPVPPPPTASPPFVIPAKAGIQPTPTVATRPERRCTSGASSHAALGTGLRRYDGLVPLPLPCRHDGLVRWCPHQRDQSTVAHRKPALRHSGEGRIQNHAYCCNTPQAPLHVRCLITRRTGYRPAPVRRAGRLAPLRRCLAGMTGSMIRAFMASKCPPHRRPPQAPPRHSGEGRNQNHAYYCNTPRAVLHVRCLITRRTGYRPSPVRRAGRLVPLRRCLAGMTGWSAGPPILLCLAGMTRSMIRAFPSKCPPPAPTASPTPSSFRRRPNQNHAYYSNSRPERRCTSGASSHAALGTGLRRYDGLDG